MPSTLVPDFISTWFDSLEDASLAALAPDPATTAVFSTDMINGFVHFGPLSSDRVNKLAAPVASMFERCWQYGVKDFIISQDTHSPDTPEFASYPPHAIAGTEESRMIPELANLPFARNFMVIEKNSLHPAVNTRFDTWLANRSDLRTAIVVGNCTDLCVYQLAMHLRIWANARNIHGFEVIVPVDCVDTFDIPKSPNAPAGSAHPAEFFHQTFLYHMASNGVRIVRTLA